MKRKGHISPHIETKRNYELAFDGFSEHKKARITVRKFEEDLDGNLAALLEAYLTESWHTSPYTDERIFDRKSRIISKLPIKDHVQQWASCLHVEPLLCDTFIRKSCSCVKGRGTHDFVNLLRKDLNSSYEDTYYFVQLDVHHFFPNINHELMKTSLRAKIKDPKLLRFLDEFIDSYPSGLPLGVKISQILANYFLASFDRLAIRVFDILADPDKFAYWCGRYVSHHIHIAGRDNEAELCKGASFLKSKFRKYVKQGLKYYSRFADNIVILHRDKAFLHLVTEMVIMILARDYLLPVNKSWNVRPVHAGGIDVCGYVSFHDHRLLRKRNKKDLCRQVAMLRKKGVSPEEIRLRCASRIGFALHANSRNLLRKLNINMEKRLGAVIKNRKVQIPFKGMRFDQKKAFADLVCKEGQEEQGYKILLIDYTVEDSKVEKEDVIVTVDDGNGGTKQEKQTRPKKCLVIRYKRILETIIEPTEDDEENETYIFEKAKNKDGSETDKDAEFYSFTGSTVMLEQALSDFQKEDLPCPTVIKEFTNKMNKKFYKFT
ncbi:reverse transcriptase domain-containing protein [Bacteroides uniformis]|uniref:reverse transcriptase domain-containing protein n=1 Tax=Bacteroides uniformis TaxID=820 RepID=UPI002166476B|nr:reverse transcriptase domain-containing protein [Bacteroides uniformis]MCS3351620.1 reverse transcriptase domain-containing protein [Bacteroides uniformis]